MIKQHSQSNLHKIIVYFRYYGDLKNIRCCDFALLQQIIDACLIERVHLLQSENFKCKTTRTTNVRVPIFDTVSLFNFCNACINKVKDSRRVTVNRTKSTQVQLCFFFFI